MQNTHNIVILIRCNTSTREDKTIKPMTLQGWNVCRSLCACTHSQQKIFTSMLTRWKWALHSDKPSRYDVFLVLFLFNSFLLLFVSVFRVKEVLWLFAIVALSAYSLTRWEKLHTRGRTTWADVASQPTKMRGTFQKTHNNNYNYNNPSLKMRHPQSVSGLRSSSSSNASLLGLHTRASKQALARRSSQNYSNSEAPSWAATACTMIPRSQGTTVIGLHGILYPRSPAGATYWRAPSIAKGDEWIVDMIIHLSSRCIHIHQLVKKLNSYVLRCVRYVTVRIVLSLTYEPA